MLLLTNDDVKRVLTMETTLDALRQSYVEVANGHGVCRSRIDFRLPTEQPDRFYLWSTMDGGSATTGYFASRMVSDIRYSETYNGVQTSEEYCIRPGLWFGVVFLFNIHNAEPLALLQDAYLQRLRVGADAGIGVDLMAKKDAHTVGILGSGGMARTYLKAISLVRDIRAVKIYSPTPAHREAFAQEVAEGYGIEARAYDDPADVYRGVDIMASCTDGGFEENPNRAAHLGRYLEPGTHVVSNRGPLDKDTVERVHKSLTLGLSTAPSGQVDVMPRPRDVFQPPRDLPEFADHEYFQRTYDTGVHDADEKFPDPGKIIRMPELLAGTKEGRTSDDEITFSERGSLQGAQFHAVAGRVYEAAIAEGIGHRLPIEWFVEDERN